VNLPFLGRKQNRATPKEEDPGNLDWRPDLETVTRIFKPWRSQVPVSRSTYCREDFTVSIPDSSRTGPWCRCLRREGSRLSRSQGL